MTLQEEQENEFVFQQLAIQNIENMNNLKVDKIITQCPHCFNTIANEISTTRWKLPGYPSQPTFN